MCRGILGGEFDRLPQFFCGFIQLLSRQMNYAQMKMRLLKVWLQPQSLFERGLRVGKLISLRQDRSRKSARSLASSTARFISDRASSPGRWLKIFANMR
jgi:hypothetical protein